MSDTKPLTITLVQTPLYWHQIDANLAMLEEKIWQIGQSTDLIILPEMFSTGFTHEASRLAEPMNSKTFRWMKQQSAQTQAVVTGSFIVREQQNFYNRLVWMEPDGSFECYDKRHLFRMAQEDITFTAGQERTVRTCQGWKICPLICYDLRFPVWSRNYIQPDGSLAYDLLLYVANWPASRRSAWRTLLQSRAIENSCLTVGINRVGEDGNGVLYSGDSLVSDFRGNLLTDLSDREDIATIRLSYDDLMAYRQKFPVHRDADHFSFSS